MLARLFQAIPLHHDHTAGSMTAFRRNFGWRVRYREREAVTFLRDEDDIGQLDVILRARIDFRTASDAGKKRLAVLWMTHVPKFRNQFRDEAFVFSSRLNNAL